MATLHRGADTSRKSGIVDPRRDRQQIAGAADDLAKGVRTRRSLLRGPEVGSLRVVSIPACDRGVLDFERSWWMKPGAKKAHIRQDLGLSPATYYAILHRLVQSSDALAYDPLLVLRLRRRDDERRRARFESPAPLPPRRRIVNSEPLRSRVPLEELVAPRPPRRR
jgi:hypothetical protein